VDYITEAKEKNNKYGRGAVAAMCLPYVYMCGLYSGLIWKGVLLYGITKLINAQYDAGMYLRFFVCAPKHIKKILELSDEESFGSIQTKLFMKHCAKMEL
jgi:hypothetical protein